MSIFPFLHNLFSFKVPRLGGSPLRLGLAVAPAVSKTLGPSPREAHPSARRPGGNPASLERTEAPTSPEAPAVGTLRYRPGSAAACPPAAKPQALAEPALATAIVHDYLAQSGGAERVVEALHALFPAAPIYTSVYDPKATLACFAEMDVRTSFLQR
ncbi:MAG: hypothetical protein M3Y13_09140 [Armatimonadota bacterium]|nr:hypothetical protein [Armatimonadota bacterium]